MTMTKNDNKIIQKMMHYWPAIVAGLVYLAIHSFVLLYGHPHEDAYILYIYSEHFAAGDGIVYYTGGAPSEGATDFLWMLLIGLRVRSGINSALAASILNAVGIMIIATVVQNIIWHSDRPAASRCLVIVFIALILISPIAVASYVGFSTAFYNGVVALIFYTQLNRPCASSVPYLALLLGLIRPDGVIIAIAAVGIGLLVAMQQKQLSLYVRHCAIAFVTGAIYYIWRYHYFGLLLPLPLYVKSVSDSYFPGLMDNWYWLSRSRWLALCALAFIVLLRRRCRKYLLAALPAGCLVAALIFANQSQNIANRFQAPGTTVLLLLSAACWGRWIMTADNYKRIVFGFFAALLFLAGNVSIYWPLMSSYLRTAVSFDYINYFPYYLNMVLAGDSPIALTEAGRMAYWTPGPKYDLIGLNTPRTALEGPSVSFLNEIRPDLIFIHTAGTSPDRLCNSDYCELSTEQIEKLLHQLLSCNFADSLDHVKRAPVVVYQYLAQNIGEYRIVFACYHGRDVHMYALRKDSKLSYESFIDTLEISYKRENALSYYQMIINSAEQSAAPLRLTRGQANRR
jgi:hypothetical protein